MVDCLIRMCLRHDTPLYAEGSSMLSLVVASCVGPQQFYIINDVNDPHEASLDYLRGLDMQARSRLDGVGMFLDASTGDLFERNELRGFWHPFRNVGLNNCAVSELFGSRGQQVSRPSTRGCEKRDATRLRKTIGSRPGDVAVSRRPECCVFVVDPQESLTSALPSGFVAASRPRWKVNVNVRSPLRVILDSDTRGPQAVVNGECVGVYFALSPTMYPHTVCVLKNFILSTVDNAVNGRPRRPSRWAASESLHCGLPKVNFGRTTANEEKEEQSALQLASDVIACEPIYFPEWRQRADTEIQSIRLQQKFNVNFDPSAYDARRGGASTFNTGADVVLSSRSAQQQGGGPRGGGLAIVDFTKQTLVDALQIRREFASAAMLRDHKADLQERVQARRNTWIARRQQATASQDHYYKQGVQKALARQEASMAASSTHPFSATSASSSLSPRLTKPDMHLMPGSFDADLNRANGLKMDSKGVKILLHGSKALVPSKPNQPPLVETEEPELVRLVVKPSYNNYRRLLASMGVMSNANSHTSSSESAPSRPTSSADLVRNRTEPGPPGGPPRASTAPTNSSRKTKNSNVSPVLASQNLSQEDSGELSKRTVGKLASASESRVDSGSVAPPPFSTTRVPQSTLGILPSFSTSPAELMPLPKRRRMHSVLVKSEIPAGYQKVGGTIRAILETASGDRHGLVARELQRLERSTALPF